MALSILMFVRMYRLTSRRDWAKGERDEKRREMH
jgi:hypothetical protein